MNKLTNQQMAEEIDRSFLDIEDDLMRNIIRHIKEYDQPIDSDKWLMQKLTEIGKLNKENIRVIKKSTGISQTAIERMLENASQEAIDAIDPGLRKLAKKNLVKDGVKAPKSKNVKSVMTNVLNQAKEVHNKTNSNMLYMAKKAYEKLLYDIDFNAGQIKNKASFLRELGDEATAMVIGAKSRQEAMRSCIKRFNERGIPAFVDKAGREWTPEAYVNMAMRNTAKQVAEEVQTARCEDFGVNLISIDSHSGARAKCQKDQGKIFDLNNGSGETEDATGRKIKYYPWKSSSYGEPDGILGINCRHHKWPFVPGVNIHRYFPEEDTSADNLLYKQTQVQRQHEREVRKLKRECVLYNELGEDDWFKEASVRLKQKEAELKYYVDGNSKLHRRKDREQVVGFDRKVSAGAVAKAQKHYKDWARSVGAETGPERLAGYYDLKYNRDTKNTKESRLYNGYIDAVNKGRISPMIGYDQFKKVDAEISEKLDGITTASGVKVKGHTAHFVDRIIGTHEGINMPASKALTKRLNHILVPIDEAYRAITLGEVGEIITDSKGRKGQRFTTDKYVVTFNPDTQELLQTNRR